MYTPEGETRQGEYALDIAVKSVDYFSQFFSTPYTLPKLDLVAVPDFYIGAMENWGLLTFRETALLLHPSKGTQRARQYVSILVTHEIAHQWFGNLVTLEWWDQLWLKEGFATWISFLAVDRLCPDLDSWSQFLTGERLLALELDCLASSHPIEIPDGVKHPGQIDEIFDDISYSKGASIIHMLYMWLGEDAFKAGLHLYLSRHRNGAAKTQDLWEAVEEASGQPVARVMGDWTRVQGFPLVTVELLEEEGLVKLSQASTSAASPGHFWHVPLLLEVRGGGGEVLESRQILLQETEVELQLELPPGACLVVNAGQTSFCRVRYSCHLLTKLHHLLPLLPARDRLGILSDLADCALAAKEELEPLIDTLKHYSGEVTWPVLQALLQVLYKLEGLVEATPAWSGFLQLAYGVLRPSLAKLGWESEEGEEAGQIMARGAVIGRLGRLGCNETVGRAWVAWRREQEGRGEVAADLRQAVYDTVARAGGSLEVAALVDKYEKGDGADEKRLVLAALGQAREQEEVLAWVLGDTVKSQDKVFVVAGVAGSGAEGRSRAWGWFKTQADTLLGLYTRWGVIYSFCYSTRRECSLDATFFFF